MVLWLCWLSWKLSIKSKEICVWCSSLFLEINLMLLGADLSSKCCHICQEHVFMRWAAHLSLWLQCQTDFSSFSGVIDSCLELLEPPDAKNRYSTSEHEPCYCGQLVSPPRITMSCLYDVDRLVTEKLHAGVPQNQLAALFGVSLLPSGTIWYHLLTEVIFTC